MWIAAANRWQRDMLRHRMIQPHAITAGDHTRPGRAHVLFDMIGDAELLIKPEENSINAAPEVVQRVWDTAKKLGYGKVFSDERIYGITDDHIPLNQIGGYRVIDVIDLEYPNASGGKNYHHTSMDTMDKISAKSLQIVGDVALTLVR